VSLGLEPGVALDGGAQAPLAAEGVVLSDDMAIRREADIGVNRGVVCVPEKWALAKGEWGETGAAHGKGNRTVGPNALGIERDPCVLGWDINREEQGELGRRSANEAFIPGQLSIVIRWHVGKDSCLWRID